MGSEPERMVGGWYCIVGTNYGTVSYSTYTMVLLFVLIGERVRYRCVNSFGLMMAHGQHGLLAIANEKLATFLLAGSSEKLLGT